MLWIEEEGTPIKPWVFSLKREGASGEGSFL